LTKGLETKEGKSVVVVDQAGKRFVFEKISDSPLISSEITIFEWYGNKYFQIDGEIVEKPCSKDDLIPYSTSSKFFRPSLAPIEASSDPKLYKISEKWNIFLGYQDAASNFEGLKSLGITNRQRPQRRYRHRVREASLDRIQDY
jgi:hypothetical protein